MFIRDDGSMFSEINETKRFDPKGNSWRIQKMAAPKKQTGQDPFAIYEMSNFANFSATYSSYTFQIYREKNIGEGVSAPYTRYI